MPIHLFLIDVKFDVYDDQKETFFPGLMVYYLTFMGIIILSGMK